jgi:predicted Zn-dependent protease
MIQAIRKAAKPYQAEVLAALPAIHGKPGEAAKLQALYAQLAAKALKDVDPALDDQLGQAQLQAVAKEGTFLPDDAPLTKYLQGVVDKVAGGDTRYKFKVRVMDSDQVNAFNAGGSTMVVYTGLFKSVANEAELAGILGHEMTHGENRHVATMMLEDVFANTAAQWAADNAPKGKGIGGFFKSFGSKLAFGETNFEAKRDLQRGLEAQADEGGARRMASAGYDPHALTAWFARMAQAEQKGQEGFWGGVSKFLNDHPQSADRQKAVEAQIAREGLDKNAKETGEARYREITRPYREKPAAPKS